MSSTICWQCGRRNTFARQRCKRCYATLTDESPTPVVVPIACPECREPTQPAARFCGRCGLEFQSCRDVLVRAPDSHTAEPAESTTVARRRALTRAALKLGGAFVVIFYFGNIIMSGIQGFLQTVSVVQLGRAYGGWPLGAIAAFMLLPLTCGPALAYWRFARQTSAAWDDDVLSVGAKASHTIMLLIGAMLAATFFGWLSTYLIAWVADRDCQRALAYGVTGSLPCP